MNEINNIVITKQDLSYDIDVPVRNDETLKSIIGNVDGVALIISQNDYRFNISIGKCFDKERVVDEVKKQVLIYLSKNKYRFISEEK